MVIVLSHELSMDFRDAIDGARSLNAKIWCRIAGRSWPKGTDGAWDKETQAMLSRYVQNVVKPSDVHRTSEGNISLSNSTEEGTVVNQPGDAVVHNDFPQVLVVQDVRVDEGAAVKDVTWRLSDVRQDDVVLSKPLPQEFGKPDSKLTQATCDEHLGVVCFREGHRVKAGIRRHLTRREADAAHSHSEGLAATPWGAEQGLLGHFAEGSDDRHAGICKEENGDYTSQYTSAVNSFFIFKKSYWYSMFILKELQLHKC